MKNRFLDQIGHVHRHLTDFGSVKLFDITKVTDISFRKEVDGHTLTTETSGTTDTMDVVLSVGWKVKVDDQRNLLDIDTTSEQIGGDQNTGRTGTEFTHNDVTLSLVHISVHARDGKVTLLHLFLQPVDLASGVTVDNGLGNSQSLVQIAESFELPFFSVHSDVELLDTFQGQLVLLDENTDRFAHEAIRDLEDIQGHGGREKANLDLFGEELENVVDLLLETTRKHLIGLIQEELFHAVQSESTSGDHIVDTTRGSNNDMNTLLEGTDIVTDGGTSNAGMDLDVHVVSKSQDNLLNLASQLTGRGQDKGLAFLDCLVDNGKATNSKGSGFTLRENEKENKVRTKLILEKEVDTPLQRQESRRKRKGLSSSCDLSDT